MKSLPTLSACFAFFTVISGLSARDDLVTLYEQPDVQAAVVAKASPDDPRLAETRPVFAEAKAALGWQVGTFELKTTGFVADENIGKDLLPVESALVRAGPRESAPVLGTVVGGEPAEVLDNGAFWKLRLTVARPVYFLPATTPALPPAKEPMERTQAAAANIREKPVVDRASPPGSTAPARAQETTSLSAEPREGDLSPATGYEGFLKRTSGFLGLFRPPYPFALENAQGRRLAYVDVSDVILPGSLKDYLDERVTLHGTRIKDSDSGEWVIQARNLRIK